MTAVTLEFELELEPEYEAALIKMAEEANLSVDDFVKKVIVEHYSSECSAPDKTECIAQDEIEIDLKSVNLDLIDIEKSIAGSLNQHNQFLCIRKQTA